MDILQDLDKELMSFVGMKERREMSLVPRRKELKLLRGSRVEERN
jgi:hypothetical protein